MLAWLWLLLLAVLVFVVWMFIDMWNSRIGKDVKIVLTILFIIASFLTALIWLIFRKKFRRRR